MNTTKLKKLREMLNITKREVAEHLDIGANRITKFEEGGNVSDRKIISIAYRDYLERKVSEVKEYSNNVFNNNSKC